MGYASRLHLCVVGLCVVGWLGGADPAATAEHNLAITGRVVDAGSGAPVAGAEVRAGERRVTTGPDGAFAIDVETGVAVVEVRADGYSAARQDLSLADPPRELSIALV